MWLALVFLLMFMRTIARALALRVAPVERCLFIGDPAAARTIRSKLGDHGGIRANLVAHLDLDMIDAVVDGRALGKEARGGS